MPAPSKRAVAAGETRRVLMEATAQIMLEEGYAAATSRRVAARAGVKAPLLHYHFPSMDDLYLAVFRRGTELNLERLRAALASDQPLQALWEQTFDPRGTRLLLEFMALANHRKEIRAELAAAGERYRDIQVTALTLVMRQHGLDTAAFPPDAMSVLIASIGRTLVLESTLGIAGGHASMLALVERYLRRFEMPPPAPDPRPPADEL
ncbi:TetR/AcrR family transcriptional regulator [Nocardia aurantia]|uniref:HTH tetR-type domain-containing protein n=1 Tax=Nocardia aurantia TaxID=2585199 RepID=A0A7K0DUX4_9NOCA|nr:TetR/AcrR family transcriptional regulator [Nocardia aurantia]MQY29570.1 hypothetical protein [Nocardia aurantia]